jgi:hypothetical protein
MTHQHAWSRWIKGRRTGQWIRHCGYCGATERSETQPEDQERPRGMPHPESSTQERVGVKYAFTKFKAPDVRGLK